MERIIFHVDVNSAFLSWEATERVLRGEEDIRLVPSAIGGDREKRTGVILAKSIPAKRFNIITGEPVAMALRKCPDLILMRPDFKLYERNSKAFMDICRKYTPVVEKYSIDECFMDMSGMEKIFADSVEAATKLKDEIWDTLGFTVNVGISSNKILAKMASDFEKPNKVHTLYLEEIESKLWPLPVRSLFTVGRATEERLKRINISNIGELAKADVRLIQTAVGEKAGRQIHEYANGLDDSSVLSEADEAKGFSCSTTLSEDVVTAEEAYKILLSLADSATSRLRAEGVKAYCVSVTIRSSSFKDKSHQRALDDPTDITTEIYNLSKNLFDELWDGQTPLRLLGVSLTDLAKDGEMQQTLFPDREKERLRELDKAVDSIRSKYGSDKVSWGSTLRSEE
ncbi:MAG: DNA polymerase IV [Bacteroidales bacterium]|nr:DNA polymerase IV [Bacteroidales bacterium]